MIYDSVYPTFHPAAQVRNGLGGELRRNHLAAMPCLWARFGEQVCILSNNLWQQSFGGDRAVIGRMLAVDGKPFRIVGVLPAEFNLFGTSRSYDLWMPFVLDRGRVSRDDHSAIVFARRRQGVSLQAA